ncbi:uncharacterized protein [Henckelia pumila]|uniref:uncharacterized protein isoform X2 n=1 Tax=Henckelia pumila TaxID=405737 RepID=UPI003C6E3EEB
MSAIWTFRRLEFPALFLVGVFLLSCCDRRVEKHYTVKSKANKGAETEFNLSFFSSQHFVAVCFGNGRTMVDKEAPCVVPHLKYLAFSVDISTRESLITPRKITKPGDPISEFISSTRV